MEIKDPVHGVMDFSSHELAVLDCQAVQRLRLIKQLGFSEFCFPGATHNRFLHSLGVAHLSGQVFDYIFQKYTFSKSHVRDRLRQTLRLAAFLHDIGHGPLSHATEEVMPDIADLNIQLYTNKVVEFQQTPIKRQANHEDYTLKFITDSSLTKILQREFPDIEPYHIVCLLNRNLALKDDFFQDENINLRTILSQLISSEIDVDRMDYLERDAYFCGTNYGRIETNWLLSNLTYHIVSGEMVLALNRRAIYTFDDFLISRHHMHLMVYFHHKSIIYEEMLHRYLTSKDCKFILPSNIEDYIQCTDYALYEHLRQTSHQFAQRIVQRNPFRVLFEIHVTSEAKLPKIIKKALEQEGIEVIHSNSKVRLSKYHSTSKDSAYKIYVVDQYDQQAQPFLIDKTTEIFHKYEETRIIERLYVASEHYENSLKIKSNLKGEL